MAVRYGMWQEWERKGLCGENVKGKMVGGGGVYGEYRYNKKLFEIWFWIGKKIKYVFDIFLQPNYKRD